ncbi:hypothetical protein [Sinorhizobium meliloti]|uniref:hypothetical protein n=1 Tax=Rhizobium meliloti TaxID=382 RepID=UPI000FDA94C5|nr:hypothetical protein [Sinorhizobium meliloti]RVL56355.1 hypothetical protein CN137_28350 [Sinorhizobium meliloti]
MLPLLADAEQVGGIIHKPMLQSLGMIDAVEAGVAVNVMLSYRAVKAWSGMIDLEADLPEPIRRTVKVAGPLSGN